MLLGKEGRGIEGTWMFRSLVPTREHIDDIMLPNSCVFVSWTSIVWAAEVEATAAGSCMGSS